MKNINALDNIAAKNLDVEGLSEVVKNLRAAHKAVTTFGDDHDEARERYEACYHEIQTALDADDLDKVSTLTTERKRIKKKLEDTPAEKIQKFDECVDDFMTFIHDGMTLSAPQVTDIKAKEKAA